MKKEIIIGLCVASTLIASCNKDKSFMKNITANWDVETSTIIIIDSLGQETVLETVSNAGKLMVYDEDPEKPSKEMKLFDFYVLSAEGDTIVSETGGTLITDERNKRIIMTKTLNDSTHHSDLIWTIEQDKKRKQTWSCYGVDSVLFYPTNNHNPGAASNWIEWEIELKKN